MPVHNKRVRARTFPVKKTLLAMVLLGAGLALAQLYVEAVAYYPVVKVSAPGGIEFTIVHDAIGSRRVCGATNREFINPIRSECKQCKVVYARCELELKGAELALIRRQALPFHTVAASNMRLLVTGPAKAAKRACEALAVNVLKNGVQTATCLGPSRLQTDDELSQSRQKG